MNIMKTQCNQWAQSAPVPASTAVELESGRKLAVLMAEVLPYMTDLSVAQKVAAFVAQISGTAGVEASAPENLGQAAVGTFATTPPGAS